MIQNKGFYWSIVCQTNNSCQSSIWEGAVYLYTHRRLRKTGEGKRGEGKRGKSDGSLEIKKSFIKVQLHLDEDVFRHVVLLY